MVSKGRGGDSWSEFIEGIVNSVSFVAAHYSYNEEYVLDHTPDWIRRKYNDALKQKYQNYRETVYGQFQSLLLFADQLLNEGKNFNEILPPTPEEIQKEEIEQTQENSKFTQGTWWKSG
ncbi:TPA: hypothetical protein ROY06_005452 [Bacillus cereus]|nr:hypothetical protein [Bacillus cereus]